MAHLPIEILIKIFNPLHRIDKVECMLVCRHWKDIIEAFSLFRVLEVPNQSVLDRVTMKIRGDPYIANSVQALIINPHNANEININELLSQLPKLKMLSFSGRQVNSHQVTLYPWFDSIEHLVEDSLSSSLCVSLFSSGTCSKLSTLSIGLTQYTDIIPLLQNAPALKNMKLTEGIVNYDDINALHDNIPSLTSITLNSVILYNVGFRVDTIKPVPFINHFSFSGICERNPTTSYISIKYPNLSTLNFPKSQLAQPPIFYDNEDLHEWVPLFNNLAHRLKNLTLLLRRDSAQIFDVLDQCGCQVDFLGIAAIQSDVFEEMAQSQQAQYIQTLLLENANIQSYQWMNHLKVLKDLTLVFKSGSTTSFNDILTNAPSTLRSLALFNCSLTINPNYTDVSAVETLCFNCVPLPERMDRFIDHNFPKLSKLELYACLSKGSNLNLPLTNLNNFHCSSLPFKRDSNILINTSNNNQSRLYSLRKSDYFKFYRDERLWDCPYKTYSRNETDIVPDVTFNFNSVKNIGFEN